ncbi:hypothetical protein ScPMuIL_015220 [Solemya velum]
MATVSNISEQSSFDSDRSRSGGGCDDGMFSSNSLELTSEEEGYDYDFNPDPDEKYICPICLHVLREPYQTECGHRFCKACIHRWLREGKKTCPIDSTPLELHQMFPDNFAKREILALTVRCPNYKQGCVVVIVLKQIKSHIATCPFALIPCPNQCMDILLRRDLNNHILTTCSKRRLECPHCHQKQLAGGLQTHIEDCPQVMVKCDCEKEMLREQLRHHLLMECSKAHVRCEFYPIGCDIEVERSELSRHMGEAQSQHMNMLCNGIVTLLNIAGISRLPGSRTPSSLGLLATEVSVMSSFQTQPQTTLEGMQTPNPLSSHSLPVDHLQLTEYRTGQTSSTGESNWTPSETDIKKSTHLGSENTQVAATVSYTSEKSPSGLGNEEAPRLQLLSFLSNRDENLNSMKAQNDIQDESLAKHHQEIMELKQKNEYLEKLNREMRMKLRNIESHVHDLEGRTCNGTFQWKIRNYSRCRREAETGEVTAIHSSPFYSSSYGYRLCIRVNLNGVDTARGTHLSVFVHFMQGEHDDIIEWPFGGRIILSILDQNPICEMRRHVVETLLSKPNLAAFQRPASTRNHKGFGYMEFLPLNLLDNSTYVSNDTLIVKAQVISATS